MGFEEMEAKLEKEDGCGRKIEVDFFGGGGWLRGLLIVVASLVEHGL